MEACEGNQIWLTELNIYGRVKKYTGEKEFIPFRYQGQYEDCETGLYYNRFRYYLSVKGMYTQQDPIGLAGGNSTLYAYVSNPNMSVDPFGLYDFNQVLNQALEWLIERGFKADKATIGRLGETLGKPVGMQTMDNKIGFRIEYDARSGAHINTWARKEKEPHFQFDADEKTVKKIQKRYNCEG